MSLSNKRFRPALLSAAIAASVTSVGVFAQEAQEGAASLEEVSVTGFRKSVMDSIDTKRDAKAVVEAISAEDIGKLPDSSIAESIARLPGLAAQRLDGRASRVSIRGFGENESATTFNGREQVSISDNRGVEFDLYPSEIMSGVTVYKTPTASIEAEGIAGVIDMQTVKPLERGERVIKVNSQYEMTSFDKLNPDGEDQGHRATVSYIDQFADDTIGVAFAFNTMSSPNQEERWNAWGYPEFTAEDGNTYSILGGAKPFVRSSVLDRDSVMLVVEAQPNDKLNMTFDALYVDFSDEKILRGIEIPFAWGQGSISPESATVDPSSGFITGATTEGQRVVVRNDLETRAAELNNFGFNTKYDFSDTLQLEFDASYSAVERDIWSFESYAGTGRGNDAGVADDLSYTFDGGNTGAKFDHNLDYSDYSLIQLGGPLTWGWSAALNDSLGITGTPLENTGQDGFLNTPEIDDELTSLKLAATQMVEAGIVNEISYGVSYRDREKTKKSEGYFMTLSNFPEMLEVPEQYRLGTASLDFIGMGDMIAYDAAAMLKDGYYSLLAESLTNTSHLTKSWSVSEAVTAAFAQAGFETEVAGLPLTGNAGLRYVYTEQQSQGAAGQIIDGLVVTSPTDITHDYSHFLPSLNLALAIDEQQTVRFGAAKTISRARMDEMNASILVDYFGGGENARPDENGNFWSVSGGNPELEPKEAIGLDLSYENYFSEEGYFSAALFWKDLSNWHFDDNYIVDLAGVADPETGIVPENTTATGYGKINAGGGTLQGYELSVVLPFNMFSESLDGFGLLASHTGLETDIQDQNGNDYQLPGLSESIQTLTAYYENYGFSARASMRKRDDFKGEVYGVGFDTQQVDVVGETIVDVQLGYDFAEAGISGLEGLSVYLQGQNLTDEPFTTLSGDNSLQVRDYQSYGSIYLLGFSYEL
ncbi:TonB-dependent receptor [Microbulbifer flavimaris]|uniref:TonB-dependent receptor n=1 Tax=Microbulbifer flavimaris TaxID=1781068 RepID=A0ABX4I1F6_9GAMM|nr:MULTISPECIES: TonB-dependent receptor [Microbulbifer]KUJ83619.1 ligand-gated channel protein [Microbulbifer sp. ZGT114]PCO05777.1 TonB-dependent receptor [Microbulbifer flavimaris]